MFGPRYLKDIQDSLPQIPLMPTGGIDVNNIDECIKMGAVAAGVGSTLVGPMPSMTIEKIGYGAGQKDFSNHPNVLRVVLGHSD